MTRVLSSIAVACLTLTSFCAGEVARATEAVARDGKPAPAAQSLRDFAIRSMQGRYAYGVYIKNKKVGWQVEEYVVEKRDGKDVFRATTDAYMALSVDGEKSVTKEKMVMVYELEGEGAILSADVTLVEDGKTTVRQAVRKGKELILTTREGKRSSTRKVPLPGDTIALEQRFDTWLRSGLKKGDRFSKRSVSWDQDEIDVEEVYHFREVRKVVRNGVPTSVLLMDVKSRGAHEETQLLPDGKPLISVLSGLLMLKLEKEEAVKDLDKGDVDIMAATAIAADKDLGRARTIEKLTLELIGLGDFALPQSHRQKLRAEKSRTFLELSRDFKVGKPEPLAKADQEQHRKATASLQCDHEAIRTLAAKIVGEETDPVKKATLIQKWVYKNLRKSYSDNADNALAVLDRKAGDCTEHTLLFVALARAAGLPSRDVGGVAFVGNDKPMFGWHAWAEIHDGKQWVTIDPTWGQVYVDATHIKLSEGARDLAWVNLVGRMKVKVVSFERK